MLINLTNVFASEGKSIRSQVPIEMEIFSLGQDSFPVTGKSQAEFIFTNTGIGKIRAQGNASVTLQMKCARCLKELEREFLIRFDREIYSPDAAESEEADGQPFMEGYQLNVEDLISNEILLNWPMKVLCREDCRGICMKCGKDLNTGNCDCDTFIPDPRMAVIKDIFDKKREV